MAWSLHQQTAPRQTIDESIAIDYYRQSIKLDNLQFFFFMYFHGLLSAINTNGRLISIVINFM